MKKLFLFVSLFLLALVPAISQAQSIPNGGFETWTATTPPILSGWTTNYYPAIPNFTAGAFPVTRTTTAHGGTYAVQGAVVNYTITGVGSTIVPPLVASLWFPYVGRPGNFTGWYRFTSVGNDSLSVTAFLAKNALGIPIAEVSTTLPPKGAWTQFVLPLQYVSGEAADSAWVEFTITNDAGGDSVHIGSLFLLDDIAFAGQATGIAATVDKPATYALDQNFPNPFNPSTVIRYALPEASHVQLSVYNLLGEELRELVNDQKQAGVYEVRFDASGLASGTYFYRIEAQRDGAGQGGSFVQVRKMTIVK